MDRPFPCCVGYAPDVAEPIGGMCFIGNQAENVCKHVPDSQTWPLDGGDLPI